MRKFRKLRIKFNEILILIIFIAVTSFTVINIKDLLKKEEIKNITEAVTTGSSQNTTSGVFATLFSKEDAKLKVTGNAIAVLDIPSRGIRGQITPGTDEETLKNYIGWFDTTAEPGQIGNFCIAAHNNIYTELFANLHNVQIGDKVRVVTTEKEYVYRVTSKEIVDPDRTDVLNSGTKREITMITCTAAATKRVVVKGELVSEITLED